MLNRLTQDTRSNRTSTQWSYDATGNIQTTANSATGMSNAYCYDGSNSQLLSVRPTSCTTSGGSSFSYNANGDRTGTTNIVGSGTVNSYGYNQNDQLISFRQGSTTASYSYDGTGLRASKTVGSTTEGYVWDVAEGMPTILQDGSTRYVTGPGGLPIEQVDGSGNAQYYVQDQLGSTRGLLDASGNIVGTYTFDAYGGLKGHGGTASTPFGYAGQYTDSESGLQYLRARYYDPSMQQFLTVDPMAYKTGQPYTYTADNPVSFTDPTGMICGVPNDLWPLGLKRQAEACGRQAESIATGALSAIPTPRGPDYATLNATAGVSISLQYARSGHFYVGFGYTNPPSGGIFAGLGWLASPCVTPQQVDNFVNGATEAIGGAYRAIGVNVVDSPKVQGFNPLGDTTAIEIGLSVPPSRILDRSANISTSWEITGFQGPGWGNRACGCH